MKGKTNLRVWADLMESDLQWMNDHGWFESAYVARYGSTENPKMGDGGTLIWQADIVAHAQRRDQFLAACAKHRRQYGYGPLPDFASKLLVEMEKIPLEVKKIFNARFIC